MDAGIAHMRENVAETIIGAVVVAVAVLFVAFAYMRTGSGSLSGYEIQARLPRVDGIGIGTDVRLSGIKIGSISDLTLDPKNYLVTVHMNIRDDIKIPVDSSLMVTSSGLLGSSYISLTPGGDDKMLAAGGMIQNSQGSVDLMGLVGRFIGGGGNNNQSQPKPQQPQQQPQQQQQQQQQQPQPQQQPQQPQALPPGP
jgi:phospholipid/cholesterol/gamma-HCH transport system substrate-binding protein